MSAMPVMIVVLCCLAIAYRYYSAFLAAKVAALDDTRVTPAHELEDGQNYDPTHKWVLFGHHFAAISGAGPLIGPVLAIQFGYLPGLIWIVIGVCLAGAVQDMLVLAASVRRQGRSLAEIARAEISSFAGGTASLVILFVVVVALSGLGIVVVKALGGEEIKVPGGTTIELVDGQAHTGLEGQFEVVEVSGRSSIRFPSQKADKASTRTETYKLLVPLNKEGQSQLKKSGAQDRTLELPAGTMQKVPGSSWGTFTIACTIPIALFIGFYMYKLRKGRVVEASAIGAIAVLAATYFGYDVAKSDWAAWFSLTRAETIWAICLYGFVASVLPVWMLLCPRDYLSSFLKIGTVVLIVLAVFVANPQFQAPPVNPVFAAGGGPTFDGAIFPFCFICIMCGAISGFHALVSSGTTPKMVAKESHIRTIGYGAMLIEGVVGIVALIAAASLPPGDYYALNINLTDIEKYQDRLVELGAEHDNLGRIEQQVGGESLRGRTGGAVTLAVGMSNVFSEATKKISGDGVNIDGVIKYWYHFAIMFEALFILTTIDAGTRIARFLLQEFLGKFNKKFDRTDWLPGAILSTGLVTAGWGSLIATGSIGTIWPMFGIANQLLAVIALAIVTTVMINSGRRKYAFVTIIPMLFVITTTMTASVQLLKGKFFQDFEAGWSKGETAKLISGGLNMALTVFMMVSVLIILGEALRRWTSPRLPNKPD